MDLKGANGLNQCSRQSFYHLNLNFSDTLQLHQEKEVCKIGQYFWDIKDQFDTVCPRSLAILNSNFYYILFGHTVLYQNRVNVDIQ